jgi:hypothetical protein
VTDTRWREDERRWLADRGDRGALTTALRSCRRAGLPVPLAMLDAELFPATRFESRVPFVVEVERPNGVVDVLGATPGEAPLRIPAHRAWWVNPAKGNSIPHLKLPGVPTREQLERTHLKAATDEIAARQLGGVCFRHLCGGDEALATLAAEAPHLRALGLRVEDLSPAGLAHVARLESLRRLDLTRLACGSHVAPLGELRELIDLRLDFVPGPIDLGGAPRSLVRLALAGVRGADAVLAGLDRLPHLARLELQRSDVTDEGLKHVAACPGLVALDLWSTAVTDAGLARLETLGELETLRLDHCQGITDVGLATVARLTTLRALHLDQCRSITGKGLARLAALENLETLYLRASKRRSLTELAPARARLAAALPGCRIY